MSQQTRYSAIIKKRQQKKDFGHCLQLENAKRSRRKSAKFDEWCQICSFLQPARPSLECSPLIFVIVYPRWWMFLFFRFMTPFRLPLTMQKELKKNFPHSSLLVSSAFFNIRRRRKLNGKFFNIAKNRFSNRCSTPITIDGYFSITKLFEYEKEKSDFSLFSFFFFCLNQVWRLWGSTTAVGEKWIGMKSNDKNRFYN